MLVLATMLVVAGCTAADRNPSAVVAGHRVDVVQHSSIVARHIEIELDDPARSLPCNVVDRADASAREILWRAEYELGFCQEKAAETVSFLKSQGWACRPVSIEDRNEVLDARALNITATWRCLEGLKPAIEQAAAKRPYVPVARPEQQDGGDVDLTNRELLEAIQRDLSVIGQDVVDKETTIDTALGDLNDDGSRDAVAVVTRKTGRKTPHRLLMAYLQSDEAFRLVDVWVLKTSDIASNNSLTLAIKNGTVRLDYCCEEQAEPTILVLANRKLTHANGS